MNLKEKKKSIEELYKALFSIRESLQESISMAQEAVNISQQFGGEIPRVVTDQLNSYFIPIISKFIDDEDTPGAMTPLVVFLDSVPLAMTREEPTPGEITPSPIVTTDNLTQPPVAGEDAVVDNPAEGSYAAQVQEEVLLKNKLKEEAQEKTSDKEVLPTEGLYFVKRKSNGASTLGEIGNIEDQIVSTFDSKAEAEPYTDYLNTTVPAAEKELFGTEYYVEEPKAFKQDKPDGASKKVKVDEGTLNFKEARNQDAPVLPLGVVNFTTGKSKLFNVYETWEDMAMYCEFWESQMPNNKVFMVLTSGNEALSPVGKLQRFIHDQTRKPLQYGKFIDGCPLSDLPSKVSEYGRSLRAYVYK